MLAVLSQSSPLNPPTTTPNPNPRLYSELSLSPLPSEKYIYVSISKRENNINKKEGEISNQGSAVTQHSNFAQQSSFYRDRISEARGELEEYQAFQQALLMERSDSRKIRVYSSNHSLQLSQKQSCKVDSSSTTPRESQSKRKQDLSYISTPKLKLTIPDRPKLKHSSISSINNLFAIKRLQNHPVSNPISREATSQQLINRKLDLTNPNPKLTLTHLTPHKLIPFLKVEPTPTPNPQQIETTKQPPYSNCFFFSQT